MGIEFVKHLTFYCLNGTFTLTFTYRLSDEEHKNTAEFSYEHEGGLNVWMIKLYGSTSFARRYMELRLALCAERGPRP